MPLFTKKPWFGPKIAGWGWTPVSWQGWLATVIFVLLVSGAVRLFEGATAAPIAVILLVAAFIGLVPATGTSPGGPAHR